jgi:hypothetical protein
VAKNIIAQVLGAEKKVIESAETVSEVLPLLTEHAKYLSSYPCWTYQINGELVSKETRLSDGDYLSISQSAIGCGPKGCFCSCGHRGRHKGTQ